MIIIPDDSYKLNIPFKAYDGDGDYIFISYKHKDSKIVYPVIEKLHNRGFNIWYDAGLPKGKNYDIQIANHIKNSFMFINFITKTSIDCANDEEDYMVKELNIARNFKKPIFPIYLENVELDGFYLVHMLGIQSVLKHEYGDNEDLFIQSCVDALIEDFNLKPDESNIEEKDLAKTPQYDNDIVEKLAQGLYEHNAREFDLEPSFENASSDIKNHSFKTAENWIVALNQLKYRIVTSDALGQSVNKFSDPEVLKLANTIHDLWRQDKINQGWTYGVKMDRKNRTTPFLVPWDNLDRNIQNKAIDEVNSIPIVVESVDLKIVHD